jgi:hypothetical protein
MEANWYGEYLTEKHKLFLGIFAPLEDRLSSMDFYDDPHVPGNEPDLSKWECDTFVNSSKKRVYITGDLVETTLYISIRCVDDNSTFYHRQYDIENPKSIEGFQKELGEWLDRADEVKPGGHGEWYVLCTEWKS